MYEYMSWHVLLACTVDMCCTDCIVPFLHFRRGNLNNMGTVGNGEGESGGGGIERVQHPVCTCCSGESRPGGGGGGGCLPGCM
jgi:hypothetical protein